MGERVATTEFSVVYHCEFIFYRKNPSNIKIKVLDTEWKATRWNIRSPSSNKNPVTDPSFNACLRSKYNICNRGTQRICLLKYLLHSRVLAGWETHVLCPWPNPNPESGNSLGLYIYGGSINWFFFQIHITESTLAVFCVSQNTAAV